MSRGANPGREQPSLFQQHDRCVGCAGHEVCGAGGTDDRCGDPVEYRTGGVDVDSARAMTAGDFQLPTGVTWRPLPEFGHALVIGTSLTSFGCDAIRLKEFLGRCQRRSEQPDLRRHVVVLHGLDQQLVRLGRFEGNLTRFLSAAGARAVIGPGFSTWWEWSPFESLLAVARSARFACELGRGVPTVPTVVWRHERDLDRWAAWISATRASAISVDLGTARSPARWSWALRGIDHLAMNIGSEARLRLIANGPSTVERLVALREVWRSDLTFASQHPWHLAQGGKRLLDDLSGVRDDADRSELEEVNRNTFARIAARVIGRCA